VTSGVDWDRIRGVVFDVDGTLYDQRKLRLLMITEMLTQAAKGSFGPNDFRTIAVKDGRSRRGPIWRLGNTSWPPARSDVLQAR
jgi:FMN phosphatase YigB (HAD superfamily)